MQHRSIRLSAILLLALSIACGSGDAEPLARVGDDAVDDAQFAAYLRFRSLHPRDREETDRELDEYLRRRALSAAIEESDRLDRALVDAELEELRGEMLISRYFDAHLRTAVTDDAVSNYYNAHAAEYEDREVHVAHVLVRTQRRMSAEERNVALTKAREAHAQLASGREFAEVAAQYSEDAVSASRGGDLGWVREGAIDPRFSEIAFALEAGATSEPIETPFGYHVVRVIEAPRTERRPLAAVEGEIRHRLRQEAREAEIERLLGTVEIARREGGYRAPETEAAPDGHEEAQSSTATSSAARTEAE